MIINKLIKITKKNKILGRGIGTGKGKTAGRGQKGQKARGKAPRQGFEGGQTKIYLRLPKFRKQKQLPIKKKFEIINLMEIEKKYVKKEQTIIDFSNSKFYVKILGNGNLNTKVTIKANAFSKQAKEKIEKIGAS